MNLHYKGNYSYFNFSDISSANPHVPSPKHCRLTAQTPTTNMSFPTCPPVGSENSYFYPSTPTCDAGTIYYCQKLVRITGSISFWKDPKIQKSEENSTTPWKFEFKYWTETLQPWKIESENGRKFYYPKK